MEWGYSSHLACTKPWILPSVPHKARWGDTQLSSQHSGSERRRPGVQSHPQLCSKFEAGLGCLRARTCTCIAQANLSSISRALIEDRHGGSHLESRCGKADPGDLWLPGSRPCLTDEFQDNGRLSLKSQDGQVLKSDLRSYPLAFTHMHTSAKRQTDRQKKRGRGGEKREEH